MVFQAQEIAYESRIKEREDRIAELEEKTVDCSGRLHEKKSRGRSLP